MMDVTASRGHQRPGLWRTAALVAADIKLAHSVFAMPFAVLGAFMVGPAASADSHAWKRFGGKLAIVVLCMVCARTWAMLVNRLADRTIDVRNARTSARVFASGALSAGTGKAAAALSAGAFCAATGLFWLLYANPWPTYLAVPVLGWIAFYSFTKRFTALCHVFLGGALAASPIAAGIAIEPGGIGTSPALWWLAGFVLAWVAGFDVIYALADEEFDRAEGLNSVPSKFGARGAVWVSRILHAAASCCLFMSWRSEPRFGALFGAAMLVVLVLLVTEHVIVASRGKAGLDMAFFTVNGVVSCVLGVAGCIDVIG